MKRRRNPPDAEQALAQQLLWDEDDFSDQLGYSPASTLRAAWVLSSGRLKVSALRSARAMRAVRP